MGGLHAEPSQSIRRLMHHPVCVAASMQAAAAPLPIPPELVEGSDGSGQPRYEHAGGGWFVRLMPHDFTTTVGRGLHGSSALVAGAVGSLQVSCCLADAMLLAPLTMLSSALPCMLCRTPAAGAAARWGPLL